MGSRLPATCGARPMKSVPRPNAKHFGSFSRRRRPSFCSPAPSPTCLGSESARTQPGGTDDLGVPRPGIRRSRAQKIRHKPSSPWWKASVSCRDQFGREPG